LIPVIIPARSGSKGVPNKNIRLLKGKPLLVWAIEAAKGAKLVDEVYVSTDSTRYGELAEEYGAHWIERPAVLAEDVPTERVIMHAIKHIEAKGVDVEPVVTMQCTTPLVKPEDVDAAIRLYTRLPGAFLSVVSVTHSRECPEWQFVAEGTLRMVPYLDRYSGTKLSGNWGVRQKLPQLLHPNGAIYVSSRNLVMNARALINQPIGYYEMPLERSWDVDEEIDFKIIEALVQ
jgi:CMP-N-acetylneuraminic acid synthetase